MRLFAPIGMEHPSVVDDTVDRPAKHRTNKCSVKVKDREKLGQRNSHREVYKTASCADNCALKNVHTARLQAEDGRLLSKRLSI